MKLSQKLIKVLKRFGIDAAKIALTAAIILNLIAGNEINLTSKNISIVSDNFTVDKNGNVIIKDDGSGTNASLVIESEFSELGEFSGHYMSSGFNLYATEGGIFADTGVNSVYPTLSVYSDKDELGTYTNHTIIDSRYINAAEYQVRDGGTVMYGKYTGHKYRCHWTGSQLQFWVDETNVGTLSDKRLKTEIQDIDEDFIKAIKEVEMKQFKIANRNGLISFGILAQDLIEIFEKYNKNPFDYEIVQETQYRTDDDTIYYTINYEQYLILKTKAQEVEIQQLQEKDKQKDELLQDLIKRIEKLEGGNNE